MNAPWRPGSAGNRDPFAAYICDDASLDVLRGLANEMGWSAEKCAKGGLRNAVQALSQSSSPNILVVDLSESNDPINEINALAEVCEPGTMVIALGQVNDVRLYRDLITSGIHDYLLKPLSPTTMRDALIHAQEVFSTPRVAEPDAAKRHISTAVIGTRGGVGASTIATSIAWLFSNDRRRATALLDLDVHFGTGALTLDLEPGRGLTDAIDNPSRIDPLFIERAMIKANDHLSILSAEAPIHAPIMTDGSAFVLLEEEFRQSFELTVVDLPRDKFINFPHVVQEINVAVLVSELTLASARDTIRILSHIRSNTPHVMPLVVVNKVQPGMAEISISDFAASIESKVEYHIPYDIKAASNAAKMGQTFVQANPGTKSAQVIGQIADHILGSPSKGDMSTEEPKKSGLNLGSLKSLLGKK